MRTFVLGVMLAGAAACGSKGGGAPSGSSPGVPLMDGFDPGPVPANGYQIILPIVTGVEPGGSYEYCAWSDVTLDRDIDVKAAQGLQTVTGHHTVLYYTTQKQPPGTQRQCTDTDMASFRFGLGAGGEGANALATLPGDLAVHIPAGAQLVVNAHYLNASAKTVDRAQSAMNIYLADPGAHVVRASSLAFVDSAATVAPGPASVEVSCTINKDYNTWYLIPHMHRWGQHIAVDHATASGQKRLFDVDWTPEMAFHPPTMTKDPSQPYVLHKGDRISVHCQYDNTTNGPLPFGVEMCVAYAQTIDTANEGNMTCDRGQWAAF